MKRLTLLIAFIAISITSFSQQNKYYEGRFDRAKIFAQVAADEFNLTAEQQEELYTKKLKHFEDQFAANKKFKAGEISEEEKKKPNKEFGKYFNKLTGKTYKELKPFYAKVKKEIDKL